MARGWLVGVAALIFSAANAPVLAQYGKPVLDSRQHQLIYTPAIRSGSVALRQLNIVFIRAGYLRRSLMCNPRGRYRTKLSATAIGRLRGYNAALWLQRNGFGRYHTSDGRFHYRPQTMRYWLSAYRGKGLAWQKCAAPTITVRPPRSPCGRKTGPSERRRYVDDFRRIAHRTWPQRINWGIMVREHGSLMLRADYYSLHYRANVNIWKRRYQCYGRCIRATPRNIQVNRPALRRYNACMKQCVNYHKFQRCP